MLFIWPGEGQTAGVEFVSVEDGPSEPLPGEASDISASHLIRFDNLNPYTYVQKKMTIRNVT